MIRLAWATDVHLNFLDAPQRAAFYAGIRAQTPDGLLLTGDIAEGNSLETTLHELAGAVRLPVYFVLGNHDFYRSSILHVRNQVRRLCTLSPWLRYLTALPFVELSPHTALVGHDGWSDARLGDFEHSDVILNDYLLIEELYQWNSVFQLDRPRLRAVLERLGDEAADHFRRVLPEAFRTHRRVLALMHVPPFREACCHHGAPADENWLPHFSCHAAGVALREVMQAHPDRQLTVLCGHTHSAGQVRIADNLEVVTGGAEYTRPVVQQVLEAE